jgi:hypothetical protein
VQVDFPKILQPCNISWKACMLFYNDFTTIEI